MTDDGRRRLDDFGRGGSAVGPIIIDQTGLRERVSLECSSFEGPEGFETARKWFKDEMGITFTEQVRTMTTYVIRKRR